MDERLSGTVTFLFTDIEGSTVLLRQLRDAYGDLLATHSRLLRQAFEGAGGQEIDTQGDSFFVAFSSPKDAVHAAVEAQRSLADETWPEGALVKVRMGIHTGDASLAADRYLGLSVHRAARICSAGHGGQILISQTTHTLLEDQEEELPGTPQDLGPQRLKDFDRPIQIFQLVVPGLQESFPPLRTLEHTPFEGDEGRLADAARRASRSERETGKAIRILIADDQALVRAGFRMILEAEDDLEVVGEASDGGEALDEVRRLGPDVVLMDVRMPPFWPYPATWGGRLFSPVAGLCEPEGQPEHEGEEAHNDRGTLVVLDLPWPIVASPKPVLLFDRAGCELLPPQDEEYASDDRHGPKQEIVHDLISVRQPAVVNPRLCPISSLVLRWRDSQEASGDIPERWPKRPA